MKRIGFFWLIFAFAVAPQFVKGQNISLDLNYPFLTGENYFSDTYTGWFDLNGGYQVFHLPHLIIGVSARVAYFASNDEEELQTEIIAPGIFLETKLGRLKPYAGINYSFIHYQEKDYSNYLDQIADGPGFYTGLNYLITEKIYLNLRYCFTNLRAVDMINTRYNRNLSSLSAGIGILL